MAARSLQVRERLVKLKVMRCIPQLHVGTEDNAGDLQAKFAMLLQPPLCCWVVGGQRTASHWLHARFAPKSRPRKQNSTRSAI